MTKQNSDTKVRQFDYSLVEINNSYSKPTRLTITRFTKIFTQCIFSKYTHNACMLHLLPLKLWLVTVACEYNTVIQNQHAPRFHSTVAENGHLPIQQQSKENTHTWKKTAWAWGRTEQLLFCVQHLHIASGSGFCVNRIVIMTHKRNNKSLPYIHRWLVSWLQN